MATALLLLGIEVVAVMETAGSVDGFIAADCEASDELEDVSVAVSSQGSLL